jgi:hypothetical protein
VHSKHIIHSFWYTSSLTAAVNVPQVRPAADVYSEKLYDGGVCVRSVTILLHMVLDSRLRHSRACYTVSPFSATFSLCWLTRLLFSGSDS